VYQSQFIEKLWPTVPTAVEVHFAIEGRLLHELEVEPAVGVFGVGGGDAEGFDGFAGEEDDEFLEEGVLGERGGEGQGETVRGGLVDVFLQLGEKAVNGGARFLPLR
jgi:hypothetical protein